MAGVYYGSCLFLLLKTFLGLVKLFTLHIFLTLFIHFTDTLDIVKNDRIKPEVIEMFYAGYAAPAPQQMVYPQYQTGGKPAGAWYSIKSFADVQNMPLPADGSQVMLMLENEPVFYICSMMNGRKMVQGFSFSALEQKEQPKTITLEDIAGQLQKITAQLQHHEAVINELEGGNNNESDIHAE